MKEIRPGLGIKHDHNNGEVIICISQDYLYDNVFDISLYQPEVFKELQQFVIDQ